MTQTSQNLPINPLIIKLLKLTLGNSSILNFEIAKIENPFFGSKWVEFGPKTPYDPN